MNDLLQIADFGKECWTLSIVPAQALVGLSIQQIYHKGILQAREGTGVEFFSFFKHSFFQYL